MEKIGKIVIDDTKYPGRDMYCDGAVEDEILEIVKTLEPCDYGMMIEKEKSWPLLYHLSALRENIINWIPLKKTDRVLEVGSGCGAITGALAAKAGSVTCVELSRKRSQINAYRHAECDNVTIKLGNFQDIEPLLACDYDYIFLIGVFEYAQSYIGGDDPFATFMGIMQKHLSPDGRLVIAIENRLGLKYWAGCREDHLGTYFDGIEGYPNGGGVRTFTRAALEKICRKNGITEYSFYYPYPDYKFMTCLYSDARLPKVGELSDNMRNFDGDRLRLFDEKHVFDGLIREGLFPWFSNSYLLMTGKELPVIYSRFSNDRAPEYAIRTEIRRETEAEGEALTVRKIPATQAAVPHVRQLLEKGRKLEEAYGGSGLMINRCALEGDEAVFEYLSGRTLEELLDECLERDDAAGFEKLFTAYCDMVQYPEKAAIYNYDLIFSNIIITEAGWNLIDYEWVFDGSIPPEYMITRALQCYSFGSEKRKQICRQLLQKKFGYGDWEIGEIAWKEKEFQKYSTGKRMSMAEIRDAIDWPIVPVLTLNHRYLDERSRNCIQIYEDHGAGFMESQSYILHAGYQERELLTVEIEGKPGVHAVRLDPARDFCIVRVPVFRAGMQTVSLRDKGITVNGTFLADDMILFATDDPGITILHPGRNLHIELEVSRISRQVAECMEYDLTEKDRTWFKGLKWFSK